MARNPMYKVEEVVDFSGKDGFQVGDTMQLEQVFEWAELFGWEKRNRYKATSNGEPWFVAEEAGNTCERVCCKQNRKTTLQVHRGADENFPKVLQMHKPFICPFCIDVGPCGSPELKVFPQGLDPEAEFHSGKEIATVTFDSGCKLCCGQIEQDVEVQNEPKYKVTGNACCSMPPCCELDLEIIEVESEQAVGSMTFHAQSFAECCKKTNRFDIEFPPNAGPADKGALVGAAFLTDLWIESQNDNDGDGGGN